MLCIRVESSLHQQIKYTLSLHLLLLLADREHPAATFLNTLTIDNRGTSKLTFGNYLLMVLNLELNPEAVEDMKWLHWLKLCQVHPKTSRA